jgi:transposase
MARSKRSFSVASLETTVAYVLEQNKSIAAAARELGIGESTLGNWVSAARQTDPDSKGRMDREEREEVRRLRAENRELQMRVELLKKAAAFFANETQN